MIPPLISIIVPVYNGEKTITACVESIIDQEFSKEEYEIIVVDNKSTDKTREIVEKFHIKLVSEDEIQSSYAARNLGVTIAKGEIILFIDADCIAKKDWISKIIEGFNDPEVGAIGGEIDDAQPSTLVERFLSDIHPLKNCMKFEGVFLPILITANAAFRKNLFIRLGGFKQNLYTIADIDLSWRLLLETKYKINYVPDAIVFHKHRTTLKGMYKQQYRSGLGIILLDAMYKRFRDYPYQPREEYSRIIHQIISLLIYTRSIIFRLLTFVFRGLGWDYVLRPVFYFIAELGNLLGKLRGLWITRLFTIDLNKLFLEDPRER